MLRAPSCINNIILSLFLPNIGMAKCVELNASSPISILLLILPHLYQWLIISIFPFLLPYLYRQLTISISPFSCQICTRSYPSASCLPPITSVPGVKHTTKSIPLDLLWLFVSCQFWTWNASKSLKPLMSLPKSYNSRFAFHSFISGISMARCAWEILR